MAKVGQLFFRVQDRGGEAFARYLATALEERGHSVASLGYVNGSGDLGAVSNDWTVLWNGPPTPISVLRASARLFKWLKTERPDAVVSHTQVASLIGLPVALIRRVPVRVCLHHQPHGRDLGWPFYVSDAIWGTLGVYTDIVLVSDLAVDRVSKFPRRYRQRVRLIRNEVPTRSLPTKSEARADLGIADHDPVFCFVGAISQKKGAIVAAQAVLQNPTARLIMVGKPDDEYSAVLELAAAAADRILVLGHVSPDDIPTVFAASDALIFPSVAENRSLAVLEARNGGLQILASDIRGNRDILGEDGRYVALGDQPAWNEAVNELAASCPHRVADSAERENPFSELVDAYEGILAPG